MKTKASKFEGVLLIELEVYVDERGFFFESFEKERYYKLGITENFVQDNHSRSGKNVLRGMHFTREKPQSQLLTVTHGKIYDVVVDIRKGSSTFGEWFGTELCAKGTNQIYMAHGFAHGFCVLSDWADLHYKVSQSYDPEDDGGLLWNDSEVNIQWPIKEQIISDRDSHHGNLFEIMN